MIKRFHLEEWVAAFGLVLTILVTVRVKESAAAAAVGPYITASYWFTAPTSFANLAVTIARGFSDTFAGIRPLDVPILILAQFIGGVRGARGHRLAVRTDPGDAKQIS